MIDQKKNLQIIIYEQNKIIKKLTYENKQLIYNIQKLKHLEHISCYNIRKTQEAFEIAKHNAGHIIMKAIDFSYSIKEEVSILLENINNNKNNYQNILKLIDIFFKKNEQIFSFSINKNEKILEIIKKEIINKIK